MIAEVPVSDYVAAVSVGMIDGKPALDLDYDEDSTADVDMNIIMTGDGRFIEVQGTAEREPFSKSDMEKLLTIARGGIEEIIAIQKKALQYDKSGEEHYNLISALHKSMRDSDPDASIYWLAMMLEGGEETSRGLIMDEAVKKLLPPSARKAMGIEN